MKPDVANKLNARFGPFNWSVTLGDIIRAKDDSYYTKAHLEIVREADDPDDDLTATREAWGAAASPDKAAEQALLNVVALIGDGT